MKIQATEWEKILANHMSERVLIISTEYYLYIHIYPHLPIEYISFNKCE